MKKLKLLFASLALIVGSGTTWAQVPFLPEKGDFGGTAATSLSTFVPNGTTYTLELTGCVADTEITVPGGSFSYTPTADGTVRFVRNGGNVVYVYEGSTYKGTVSVSNPADPTYPTGLTSASSENLIQNGGFEDITAGTYSGQSSRWYPTHWDSYKSDKSVTGNGTSVRNGSPAMTGSYNMLMHNDGYYLTQKLASGKMKNFTPYQITYNYRANATGQAGAKYKFQVGSEEFKSDYFNSSENNKGTETVQTYTTTFTTPATIVEQPYVQLYRTSYVSNSSNQDLDRFDEFILVAANGGGIGITGATGATFLSDKAYAPEGVLATALEGGPIDVTSKVTNPTFDTNLTGWNSPIGGGSEIKVADNKQDETRNFYQTWNSTPKEGRMYQVIENLPQGTYELELIAFADQEGTMTAANTAVAVYAQGQDVGTTGSSYIRPNYVNSASFTSYKAYAYVDATGKLEIGMRQYKPAAFKWLGMDNVTLKYIATDNQEEAKMLELYQAKWTAVKTSLGAILSDDEYANVTGSERTALSDAIAEGVTVSAIGDYKTNADNAQTEYLAFIAAKANYDALAAKRTDATTNYTTALWPYASTAKKTALDNAVAAVPTDAADAVTKTDAITTAIRQFVESSGVAEGVAVAVSYASAIAGADPDVNTGWTGGIGVDNRDEEKYTDGSGNASGKYYDGGWSKSAVANITMTRTFTLPAGQYLLQVTARGSEKLKEYTMSVGEESVNLPKQGSGENVGTFGHGWSDCFFVFESEGTEQTLTIRAYSEGEDYEQWISFNRFRLTKLDATLATAEDYENLNNAIATAEANLGFEDGQNAPYNNVASMELLAAAKAIDQTANNVQSDVQDATTALTGATWTANDGDVNAFYDGDFSEADEDTTTPLDAAPTGWTASSNMRLMLKNAETYPGLADASASSAIMSWSGGITYGEQTGYEMPLAAHTIYELSLKAAGWNNETRSGITVSVLNSTDGMAAINLGTPNRDIKGNDKNTAGLTTFTIVFATGEAGNYVFHVQSGNNFVLTDLVLKKAASQVLEFADGEPLVKFAPGTYPTVKVSRTMTKDRWVTAVYPFALSIPAALSDMVSVATLNSYNKETGALGFTSVTANTANVPFLMRSTNATAIATINTFGLTTTNVEVAAANVTDATADEASMKGTYAVKKITNAEKNYVLSNNTIYPVGTAGATINPYRAYIQVAQDAEARLSFFVDDEEVTGIEGIQVEKVAKGTVYNLNGQRVEKAKKGLYIQNGKKIVVK